MVNRIKTWWEELASEISGNRAVYLLLSFILVAAFFLRVYRLNDLLGFYYDQGRDALVIWDFWHKAKFFLIGPTTGIAGIFRGPFYYYLIAPFYLLGGGNPVWPSVFLSFTTVAAIFFVYLLGTKIVDRTTGIIGAIIASFSFNLVMTSRWLSNPTPMLLLSMILVWAMIKVTEGKKWAWPVIAFVTGASLFHFGSSGEVFYFPALLVFIVWTILRQGYGGRSSLNNKVILISAFIFFLTFLPLLIFDLKHEGILRNNISKFLVGEKSFAFPTWKFINEKIGFYYEVFTNKIFHGRYDREKIVLSLLAFFFVFYLSKMLRNEKIKVLLLLFIAPILGLIFFQGNFGNIYDYYLTGYYLIFILLVALPLGYLWRSRFGKIFVVYFMYLFFVSNSDVLNYKLSNKCSGELSICYINQKQTIDWIYQDSNGKDFNVDVYVPPVIPYAYDYLFAWYSTTENLRGASGKLVEDKVPLLYTLFEVDPPHPERLEAWLDRQRGIAKIEKTARFGGITIERRIRK